MSHITITRVAVRHAGKAVAALALVAAISATPAVALTNIIKAQSVCLASVQAMPDVGPKAAVAIDQSQISTDGDNFYLNANVRSPEGASTVFRCTVSRKSSETVVAPLAASTGKTGARQL